MGRTGNAVRLPSATVRVRPSATPSPEAPFGRQLPAILPVLARAFRRTEVAEMTAPTFELQREGIEDVVEEVEEFEDDFETVDGDLGRSRSDPCNTASVTFLH